MTITVDRLTLAGESPKRPGGPHVLAYLSLLIDDVLIVDCVRLIRHGSGRSFVAMPDKPASVACLACNARVGRRDAYCRSCGDLLPDFGPFVQDDGRCTYFHDVVRPISGEVRRDIEATVKRAYLAAVRALAEHEAWAAPKASDIANGPAVA